MTTTTVAAAARPWRALRAAGASDAGRIRDNNEDRFHLDPDRGLFIVVDGIGGQAGGETAAETALLQVRTRLEREAGSAADRLREAITLANNEVYRLSRTNAEWTGMACVLTAAIVEPGAIEDADAAVVTIGHVGDSRLYKLRRGGLAKLTHDHSPVGEREDAGEIDETEAMQHPRRNEVFRDVGSERHTPGDAEFVEIVTATFEPDAALLLCSDGLTDLVSSHTILAVAQQHAGHPERVVQALIDEANRAGGKDNVTVVYVEGPGVSADSGASTPAPTSRRAGRRTATHVAMLMTGLVLGAAVMSVLPEWLTPWLPGAPVTAVTEVPRPPRVITVQPSAAAEFATIGDALAAAQPGDTIVVGPGDYREQLRLRPGVAVVSESLHRAVLRPPAEGAPGAAVTVDGGRGARLRGFQIAAEPGRLAFGVLVLAGELELEDTRISATSEAAVDIWGASSVTLRANDLSGNAGVGVRVRPGAEPSILHNIIVRNGRGRPLAPGVLLDTGAAALLIGNVIAENGAEGIAGVVPRDRADILRHNVFVADTRANGRGALRLLPSPPPVRR